MYLKTFDNHGHLCQNQSIEYYKEMYELSDDIGHIKMHREITEIIVRKNKNVIFHVYVLLLKCMLNAIVFTGNNVSRRCYFSIVKSKWKLCCQHIMLKRYSTTCVLM